MHYLDSTRTTSHVDSQSRRSSHVGPRPIRGRRLWCRRYHLLPSTQAWRNSRLRAPTGVRFLPEGQRLQTPHRDGACSADNTYAAARPTFHAQALQSIGSILEQYPPACTQTSLAISSPYTPPRPGFRYIFNYQSLYCCFNI